MRRVTVTLPDTIVDDINRRDANRSRFVTEAVVRELNRRRYQELQRSIHSPHPEGGIVAEMGVTEWAIEPEGADEILVDPQGGRALQWEPGTGWTESRK